MPIANPRKWCTVHTRLLIAAFILLVRRMAAGKRIHRSIVKSARRLVRICMHPDKLAGVA